MGSRLEPEFTKPYAGARAMCLYSLGRVREAAHIADSHGAAFMAGTGGDSIFSPGGHGSAQSRSSATENGG